MLDSTNAARPPFSDFAPNSHIWFVCLSRVLTEEERSKLLCLLEEMLGKWVSHGRSVRSEIAIFHNQILVIAADESQYRISGCGIDSLMGIIESILGKLNLAQVPDGYICYRNLDGIHYCSRPEFKRLIMSDQWNRSSFVFDLSLSVLSDYIAGKFELPYRESWVIRAFPVT